jgi:molybdopterin converting factor small subunit
MNVRVLFIGRGYSTTGDLPGRLVVRDGGSIDDALAALHAAAPQADLLPPTALLAVGGKHIGTVAHHRPCPLADGDELVVIAPVAGG